MDPIKQLIYEKSQDLESKLIELTSLLQKIKYKCTKLRCHVKGAASMAIAEDYFHKKMSLNTDENLQTSLNTGKIGCKIIRTGNTIIIGYIREHWCIKVIRYKIKLEENIGIIGDVTEYLDRFNIKYKTTQVIMRINMLNETYVYGEVTVNRIDLFPISEHPLKEFGEYKEYKLVNMYIIESIESI